MGNILVLGFGFCLCLILMAFDLQIHKWVFGLCLVLLLPFWVLHLVFMEIVCKFLASKSFFLQKRNEHYSVFFELLSSEYFPLYDQHVEALWIRQELERRVKMPLLFLAQGLTEVWLDVLASLLNTYLHLSLPACISHLQLSKCREAWLRLQFYCMRCVCVVGVHDLCDCHKALHGYSITNLFGRGC